ncbi:YHS domain-containing protein [Thermococcus stetteri]|uniref:YHS domain-containing protein n=1 Tax=Thermococcus stetteri TaxID=49900 RepID=UPI001AE3D93E|nr:YHS domain-containing protein [Thermococcus stetteri]MBP1912784.1 YHS domain-containing protein [Thermococcus stetteri]
MPVDPVCGMEVDENTEIKVEYKGKVYYFCSPGCRAEFEANPEKYVKEEKMKHKHGMHSHEHGHGHRRHGCCH